MKLFNIIIISVAAAAHAKSSREDAPSNTALRGAGLRQATELSEEGPYHHKFLEEDWKGLKSGRVRISPVGLGWNMQFAEVQFFDGGVRDLHW